MSALDVRPVTASCPRLLFPNSWSDKTGGRLWVADRGASPGNWINIQPLNCVDGNDSAIFTCTIWLLIRWVYRTELKSRKLCKRTENKTKTKQRKNKNKKTTSTGTEHTSAKARLTSVAVRIQIATKIHTSVHWPIANLLWKFHANPFGSFCAKLLTDKHTDKQRNSDENITR